MDKVVDTIVSDISEKGEEVNLLLINMKAWIVEMLPIFLSSLIIFFLGWWLARIVSNFVKRTLTKSNLDASIVTFLSSLISALLKVIVCVAAISKLGINVNSIIAALGAASVAAGLAVKDTLANVASGVLIVLNKPFKLGDYVELKGIEGTVSKIEIMFTSLVTVDNKLILLPNSLITSDSIINYTANGTRRLDLTFCVGNNDIAKAKEVLREIVMNNVKIIMKEKSVIGVESHNYRGAKIIVKIWCNSDDYLDLQYEFLETAKSEFNKYQIIEPCSQVEVHIAT